MIYAVVFVVVSLLAALALHAPRLAKGCGTLIALLLFAFAGARGASTDYDQYVAMYDLMRSAGDVAWPVRLLIGKDPLFGAIILGVVTAGLGAQWLFTCAAALSVGVKWAVFERTFGNAAAALLATLFGYYFLHDFTQIRSGIAITSSSSDVFVPAASVAPHTPGGQGRTSPIRWVRVPQGAVRRTR